MKGARAQCTCGTSIKFGTNIRYSILLHLRVADTVGSAQEACISEWSTLIGAVQCLQTLSRAVIEILFNVNLFTLQVTKLIAFINATLVVYQFVLLVCSSFQSRGVYVTSKCYKKLSK